MSECHIPSPFGCGDRYADVLTSNQTHTGHICWKPILKCHQLSTKHVLSGWCQQNCSVYEIIFSLNERLNEPLSPVDPVPAPVFNISWAIFFFFPWVALSVLVTYCLELGNVYVSLEFLGRGEGGGDKKPSLCVCMWLLGTAAADR